MKCRLIRCRCNINNPDLRFCFLHLNRKRDRLNRSKWMLTGSLGREEMLLRVLDIQMILHRGGTICIVTYVQMTIRIARYTILNRTSWGLKDYRLKRPDAPCRPGD